MALDHIRIVLSHTSHAGNIGGAARAMKNMGLRDLFLIAPSCDYGGEVARARSAGAEDVLKSAVVCTDLDAALAGCTLVIGTSARERTIAWPNLSAREAARELVNAAPAKVALLFGCERSGLSNDELDRCAAVVTIPTDPTFASLNLAAAVQILAYELYQAALHPFASESAEPRASDEEVQAMYRHLEQVLIEIAFLDPANPRKLMRRMMRLFNRTRLDQNEVNILRGILTAVQQRRPPSNT